MDRIDTLAAQVQALHSELELHTTQEFARDTETTMKMASLTEKVDTLLTSTESLLNLWQQAQGMVTLVKWLAAIGGSLASIYLFFKGK